MQTTTLRPGLLVSVKTALRGNVSYQKLTLEAEHSTADGAEVASWQTERTIANPEEHKAAKEARAKAAYAVRRVCATSAFGLLCPESRAEDLSDAIGEARRIVDAFNLTAQLTNISVYVITGRIAADDVEALRAINSEVRDLMSAMAEGVANVDATAIREAAARARQLGSMLTPDAESRVREAIEAAREAARKIVKAGEAAAQEVDTLAVRRLTELRTSFLDLDEVETPIQAPRAQVARAVDLDARVEV